jgi:hypothetical protein
MMEPGRPLNRDEMEAKIRYFDNQIEAIREGITLKGARSDFDSNSESVQKAAEDLKFYLQQKEMMVNFIKKLDSTDAF